MILTVSDNGCYTADTPLSPGFGLEGIMGRTRAFGGSYTLHPNQPHGLTLEATFPTDTSAHAVDATSVALPAASKALSASLR